MAVMSFMPSFQGQYCVVVGGAVVVTLVVVTVVVVGALVVVGGSVGTLKQPST